MLFRPEAHPIGRDGLALVVHAVALPQQSRASDCEYFDFQCEPLRQFQTWFRQKGLAKPDIPARGTLAISRRRELIRCQSGSGIKSSYPRAPQPYGVNQPVAHQREERNADFWDGHRPWKTKRPAHVPGAMHEFLTWQGLFGGTMFETGAMACIVIQSIPCKRLWVIVAAPPRCPSCLRRGADLRTKQL